MQKLRNIRENTTHSTYTKKGKRSGGLISKKQSDGPEITKYEVIN